MTQRYYIGQSPAQLRVALAADIAQGGAGAAPTAKVGVTAVNGVGPTFMFSDSAPPIDLTATFTWTGLHAFTKTGEALKVVGDTSFLNFRNTATTSILQLGTVKAVVGAASVIDAAVLSTGLLNLYANGSTTAVASLSSTVGMSVSGKFGCNGATPPAQVTGWGTPTGASVVNNFSGTAATTAQIQAAIAEIITVLKAAGLLGA